MKFSSPHAKQLLGIHFQHVKKSLQAPRRNPLRHKVVLASLLRTHTPETNQRDHSRFFKHIKTKEIPAYHTEILP